MSEPTREERIARAAEAMQERLWTRIPSLDLARAALDVAGVWALLEP